MTKPETAAERHDPILEAFHRLHPEIGPGTAAADAAFPFFRAGHQAYEDSGVWPDWATKILRMLEESQGIPFDADDEIDLAQEVDTFIDEMAADADARESGLLKEIAWHEDLQQRTDDLLNRATDQIARLASPEASAETLKLLQDHRELVESRKAAASSTIALIKAVRKVAREAAAA